MRLGELWHRATDRVLPERGVDPDAEHRNYMMDRGYTAAGVAMGDPESRYLQGAWDRYHEGAESQNEVEAELFGRWDLERPGPEVVATMEDVMTDREREAEPPENEPDEPPVQIADPTMLAVERSLPEGPERDAFKADREAGTLKTVDDRAAESDAAGFERIYGEPPTPVAEAREAGE